MPFLKGRAALKRTREFLEKGQILLRKNITVVSFAYCSGEKYQHHHGLERFVFWHLPQLKYKNPEVQFVTFKEITPTPWIRVYFDDDKQVLVDCDSRGRQEIHDHVKEIFSKSKEVQRAEAKLSASVLQNPANFGEDFMRQCICTTPGQVPCPAFRELPKSLQGKWKYKLRSGDITQEELNDLDKKLEEKLQFR